MYLKVEYKVSMYMAVLYKHAVEFDIVGTVYHLVIYIYICCRVCILRIYKLLTDIILLYI